MDSNEDLPPQDRNDDSPSQLTMENRPKRQKLASNKFTHTDTPPQDSNEDSPRTGIRSAGIRSDKKRDYSSSSDSDSEESMRIEYQGTMPDGKRFRNEYAFNPPNAHHRAEAWLRDVNEIKNQLNNLVKKCDDFVEAWGEGKMPDDIRVAIDNARKNPLKIRGRKGGNKCTNIAKRKSG